MTPPIPNLLRALPRALSAETLKLRGTLALWMALIAPAVVVVLYVLQLSTMDLSKGPPRGDGWQTFLQSAMVLWAFLMLPLFVTLESALLAGVEHANHQWKHLLALPLPRATHYLAKLLVLIALVLLATLVLLVLLPAGGWLLDLLQPRLGIDGMPPWDFLVGRLFAIAAAAMLIVAVHTWAAVRWRSFTVAVSIGMVATVAGFLIGQSAHYGHWYPWSMPLHVLGGEGQHLPFVVMAGLGGAVVAAMLGLGDFLRREFA